MPAQLDDDRARLSGVCDADDAADLADWLREGGGRVVLDGLEHAHCAVVQCLLAFDVTPEGACPFPLSSAFSPDPALPEAEEP